jgi:hypothetical protein
LCLQIARCTHVHDRWRPTGCRAAHDFAGVNRYLQAVKEMGAASATPHSRLERLTPPPAPFGSTARPQGAGASRDSGRTPPSSRRRRSRSRSRRGCRRPSDRGFCRRRLGVGRYDNRLHDWLDPFGGDEDGDRRAPDQYLEHSPTSGVAVAHWNSPVPNRIGVRCCPITGRE